ncbi:MAG: cytochrome c [Sphingobium sp.]|nr:cytochrome c [Sphingobium sp.]
MAKQMTAMTRLGLATVALAAASVPAAALFAQAPATEQVDAARIAKGRELFTNWGCTGCHSLVDADSHGDVGPHLDGGNRTEEFIVSRVTNGQGAMPAFGGQLTEKEIADLGYYIAHVAKKTQ